MQFHAAFVSCRHVRSTLYVSFCLLVTNEFDVNFDLNSTLK